MTSNTSTQNATSPATIAISWLAVGLPLAWGVSQTLAKAMKLFL